MSIISTWLKQKEFLFLKLKFGILLGVKKLGGNTKFQINIFKLLTARQKNDCAMGYEYPNTMFRK